MSTDQLLPAIRRLADRYGLPDGLRLKMRVEHFHTYWFLIEVDTDPHTPIATPLALPIFAAHVETEAEQRDGLVLLLDPLDPRVSYYLRRKTHAGDPINYTPGDTLSRITATLLALDDGATAIGGEG